MQILLNTYDLWTGDPTLCTWAGFDLGLRCLIRESRSSHFLLRASKSLVSNLPLSARFVRLQERFMFEAALSKFGSPGFFPFSHSDDSSLSPSDSSPGRHISTIASRMLTNSSPLSAVLLLCWEICDCGTDLTSQLISVSRASEQHPIHCFLGKN